MTACTRSARTGYARGPDSVPADVRLLFATRLLRLFAFGMVSITLALYLAAAGFGEGQIGLLVSLTLAGDAGLSLWITTRADRLGRRRMLRLSAGLMALAGVTFALTDSYWLLLLAAIVGTLSPSGNEVGSFLPIEQASLAQTVSDGQRTSVFAWYNLAGSLATAGGALAGGAAVQWLQGAALPPLAGYRLVFMAYAALGLALFGLFRRLSPAVEANGSTPVKGLLGLDRSQRRVLQLSALFAVDAFAGGLIVQSLVAYWFAVRFSVEPAGIGSIFFGANLFAGLSALAAARLAARVGLINTMVFTHLPANVLLMLLPLMPTLPLAVLVLLTRSTLSQMDVPTRQSYVMAVVEPAERAAAAGVTGMTRTIAAACSPLLTGLLLGNGWLSAPFVVAGGMKIVYDLALYRGFRRLRPPEEMRARSSTN